MNTVLAVRLLLAAAILSPLLAVIGQDPAEDWAAHVEKAANSPRYGLRLAAARKVAAGGDAAVPAVRAFATKQGANALPSALVDAIADADTTGEATLSLLLDLAADRDFYWRAAALRGLALRARKLDDPATLARRFRDHLDDPAWLMRTHARLGSALLGDEEVFLVPEPDPRARVRLAALALQQGLLPPLQPLLDALLDERTFLGDPFGARLGTEAHKALKDWLGDAHPLADGGSFDDKLAAVESLRKAAAAKSGQELTVPQPARDPQLTFAGGLELLSCKHGDQFVRWTNDGTLVFGLHGEPVVKAEPAEFEALWRERAALEVPANVGVVVCDSLRLWLDEPAVHGKVAPASLPTAPAGWLQRLSRVAEEAGAGDAAAALRPGLEQFAAP